MSYKCKNINLTLMDVTVDAYECDKCGVCHTIEPTQICRDIDGGPRDYAGWEGHGTGRLPDGWVEILEKHYCAKCASTIAITFVSNEEGKT